jgi:conjugal transfer pilus assembly protein TraV
MRKRTNLLLVLMTMEETMKTLFSFALVAGAAAMTGCAMTPKYACPHPNGVTCMSAPDVYRATNQADEVVGIDPKEAAKLAREGKSAGKVASPGPAPEGEEIVVPVPTSSNTQVSPSRARPTLGMTLEGDTLALTDASAPKVIRAAYTPTTPAATYPTLPEVEVNSAEPYRVPAKIMRIYVHPWEDEAGDLHMGGLMFTEIEPRRWSVTPSALHADSRRFELLEAPKQDAAQDAASKGNEVATPSSPPQGVVAPTNHNGKGNSP